MGPSQTELPSDRLGRKYRSGVSVVIATHNGERFLEQQLESVRHQSAPPREIIISDDNSQDRTGEIVRAFIDSVDIETSFIRNVPGLGFGDNFLTAASKANCELVAFCDQDDIWDFSKLATCGRHFSQPNVSMVVHAAELIDQAGKPVGSFDQGIKSSVVRPPLSYDLWSTFWGFSIVFRREILDLFNPSNRFVDYIKPTTLIAHDRWVTFLCQLVGSTVEIPQRLVKYRQHEHNLYGDSQPRGGAYKFISNTHRSDVYIGVARKMLEIIEDISPHASERFSLFDKEMSRSFIEKALYQQIQRQKIYDSNSLISSIGHLCENIIHGVYRNSHDGTLRSRSIGKDLTFILRKSLFSSEPSSRR